MHSVPSLIQKLSAKNSLEILSKNLVVFLEYTHKKTNLFCRNNSNMIFGGMLKFLIKIVELFDQTWYISNKYFIFVARHQNVGI